VALTVIEAEALPLAERPSAGPAIAWRAFSLVTSRRLRLKKSNEFRR
jgi:hypothetical protein